MQKNIAILGSTGSIGTQTLDIIAQYPKIFRASILTANNNWELLARQAIKFLPERGRKRQNGPDYLSYEPSSYEAAGHYEGQPDIPCAIDQHWEGVDYPFIYKIDKNQLQPENK